MRRWPPELPVTRDHHRNFLPSRKNPPVGPSSGKSTAHNTLAAPSATGRPPPPMSVLVQPGHTAFTSTPLCASSAARIRVSALSAAFDTEYAGVPAPIDASEPASEETLTIRPQRAARIIGAKACAI